LARHRARFQRGGVHARGDSVFMRGERKRIYVKFVFLRKKETEKNDPPLGFGAPKNNNQKKDHTLDSLFLVNRR